MFHLEENNSSLSILITELGEDNSEVCCDVLDQVNDLSLYSLGISNVSKNMDCSLRCTKYSDLVRPHLARRPVGPVRAPEGNNPENRVARIHSTQLALLGHTNT